MRPGFWQLVILIAVVVLVFGVRRIPEIGSGLGKGIREFKRNLLHDNADDGDNEEAARESRLSD